MTLVILCGPTGVGRSTVIEAGRRRYGWHSVPWHTDRPARAGDTDRIYRTRREIADVRTAGGFVYCFQFHGFTYGISVDGVATAISADGAWFTDLLPSSLLEFPDVPAVRIGLVAESEESLVARLRAAGRGDRQARAVAEQQLLLAGPDAGIRLDHVIVSTFGAAEIAVDEISRLPSLCPGARAGRS
jgi:ribose 1,5-bisphosphokinase PhnN